MSAVPLKLPYNPALDGLRGVAIVLVMLSHAHVPLFEGAFFGVDLFFVLSGYLITSLLLIELQNTQQLDLWRFYRRRFFRLMPALLLFLAVYCLVAPLFWPDSDDWYVDALVSAFYLADYGIAFFDLPNSLLHMWSLSVEEHFYLVWPLMLWLIVRRTPRGQVWCRIFGLFLLAWAWRVYWVAQEQQFYEIFFRFDTRATGLLAGSLLAALVMERPAWFERARKQVHHGLWLVLLVPVLMALDWDDMNVMTWAMTVELVVPSCRRAGGCAVAHGPGVCHAGAAWLGQIGADLVWGLPVMSLEAAPGSSRCCQRTLSCSTTRSSTSIRLLPSAGGLGLV